MKSSTKVYVKKDDLTFDGHTLLIPAYWSETMLDIINNQVQPEDMQDAQLLKDFICDVIDYQHPENRGGN
jgi:hypothetical protein